MGMSMTHSKFNEKNLNDVIDYTVNHLPNIDNLNLNLQEEDRKIHLL